MHDPLVVVCEIRRPLPKVRIMKQRYKRSGAYYDALSPAKKLLHNFRSPHWRFGRVELYWPSIATIWHREPGNRDAGTVCGYPKRGRTLLPWMWQHRRHLKVQLATAQALNRWLFQRCQHCGGKSRKHHPVNVSHQWDSGPQRWGKSQEGLFHGPCSGNVSLRRNLREAQEALRFLGVTSFDLEVRGFDATKAFRVTYNADRVVEKSDG